MIGRLSPIIDAARVSQSFDRYGPTSIDSPVPERLQMLLHGGDRHDAPMGVLEMLPGLLRLHASAP